MGFANTILLAFVLASTGCRNREAVLSPKSDVNVQLATKWIDLTKLRAAADEHLRTRYPEFDPSSAEVTANIYRSETNSVMFQYFWNFGLPTYSVRFDSHGQIAFATNRIATEGR